MSFCKMLPILLVALLATSVHCGAEDVFSSGLKSVVDSEVAQGVEWDYSDGPNGPANWAKLSPEFAACGNGSVQSPIDIEEKDIKKDGTLDVPALIYYQPAEATISGDGKTLEAKWKAGIYNCHNWDYVLDKLVFHSPSEHTYYNESFPLEIQFYHSHPTEGFAVNSLVFREGKSNTWLEQFTSKLGGERLGKPIDLGLVDSHGVTGRELDWSRYYRYLGSLTTPPCLETPWVVWSLLKAPLEASVEQLTNIELALGDKSNARPIQETGWRQVYYPKFVDGSN